MFNKIFNSRTGNEKGLFSSAASYYAPLDDAYERYSTARLVESYLENAPVFIATNKISGKGSGVQPFVKDVKEDKFIDHPLLTLLHQPDPTTSQKLFLRQLLSYYLLTGNGYVEVTRSATGKPIELKCLNPISITIESRSLDGLPSKYTYLDSKGLTISFERVGNEYINKATQNHLIHLRNFNPEFSSSKYHGISFFAGCQMEINQYTLATIHNSALLKNQARPSGLLTCKNPESLSGDQINQIKEQLQNKFKGAANAGASAFLPGEFDFIQLSQSIREMDFGDLKKFTSFACYNALDIPLALISPDQMTLSNIDQAKYMLWDDGILPRLNEVYSFLGSNLFPMYKDKRVKNEKQLQLVYDETTIQVLEDRKFENAKNIYASGLLTRNEGRALIGYNAEQGGDTFYQPATLVPVGVDETTASNRDEENGKSAEVDEYRRLMSSFKMTDGSAKYSSEEIERKVKTYFKNGQHNE